MRKNQNELYYNFVDAFSVCFETYYTKLRFQYMWEGCSL